MLATKQIIFNINIYWATAGVW